MLRTLMLVALVLVSTVAFDALFLPMHQTK